MRPTSVDILETFVHMIFRFFGSLKSDPGTSPRRPIGLPEDTGLMGNSLDCQLLSDRYRRLFGIVVAAAVFLHPRMTRTGRRTRFRRSLAAVRPPNPWIEN